MLLCALFTLVHQIIMKKWDLSPCAVSVESERDDERGGGGLFRVGEAEVVVDVDVLPAVLAGEVEGAPAVEVVGQVDALGGGSANVGRAIVDVPLAVLAFET